MRNASPRYSLWLTSVGMAVLGVAVAGFEQSGTLTSFRLLLFDMLSPGRLVLLSLSQIRQSASALPGNTGSAASREEVRDLQAALERHERQRRQLIIENAQLRNSWNQQLRLAQVDSRLSPLGQQTDNRLAAFHLLEARVIGNHGLTDRLRQQMLDVGSAAGVTRSELVVDAAGYLLDHGTDQGVRTGDRALSGSIVVGRIVQTSKWVSILQPITDPEFSARVQLIRHSALGTHFGSEALLQGSGTDDCTLEGVPYTEAVTVGDEVVTADVEGLRAPRLYFGRVVQASFVESGRWQIRVRPELRLEDLSEVRIVQLKLQPQESSSAGPQEIRRDSTSPDSNR